ncbi:hypothetical protein TIFTF001_048861, partial [Ficus carica]
RGRVAGRPVVGGRWYVAGVGGESPASDAGDGEDFG